VLNVREEFAQRYPQLVERVLQVYEKGRQWAQENPEELKAVLVKESKLSPDVAAKQLERTDLSNSAIGGQQKNAIVAAGSVLKKSGIIPESVNVNQVVDSLIDPQYIDQIVKK
jgi:sulfonate transport system substrate-binding protein